MDEYLLLDYCALTAAHVAVAVKITQTAAASEWMPDVEILDM